MCVVVFAAAAPTKASAQDWLRPGYTYRQAPGYLYQQAPRYTYQQAPRREVGFWESLFGTGQARRARLTEGGSEPQGPVSVYVSLGSQTMTVSVGGEVVYRWAISSGRIGYSTPHGTYRPQRLAVMWRSQRYHMSPMPHSIFFRGGYAIHGTYETAHLGARASHGCIRLSPAHAATLFSLVRGAGFGRTRITIAG